MAKAGNSKSFMIFQQDIVRINKAVKEGTMIENKNLVDACKRAKDGNGRLHLLGLVSLKDIAV